MSRRVPHEVAMLEMGLAITRFQVREGQGSESNVRNMEKRLEAAKEKARTREEEVTATKKKIAELHGKNPELRARCKSNCGIVSEGTLIWDLKSVEVAGLGEESLYSPYIAVGEALFRLDCTTFDDDDASEKLLSINIHCNDAAKDSPWLAGAEISLSVASKNESNTWSGEFDPWCTTWWDEEELLFNWTKKDVDPLKIEATIKLISYYKNGSAEYSTAIPEPSDVTLLVGGKAFPNRKKYLALFSEYFKCLFESEFAEKNLDEITLKDIDPDLFEKLLVVMDRRWEITSTNVVDLLRLADFLAVDAVIVACANFLARSKDFSISTKLKLAEEFHLPQLKHDVLSGVATTDDYRNAIHSSDFETLSEENQMILLEKFVDKYENEPCGL